MKPSYGSAFAIGAVAGLILAMALTLFAGATGGVSKLDTIGQGSAIEPVFAVPASAMWIVTLVLGAAGGAVLAIVTVAVAKVIDPTATGAPLLITAPLGAVVAAVVAIAVLPVGITALGSVADGTATASVTALTGLVATVGLTAGAGVVWLSYILSRPPQPHSDPELLAD
jgi:hypothetical protein